ncbi:hypothetical protein B0O99DRAFT_346773 [Bisporella sp. PMI_857]|nr:hypothetical protein B0O99DRAFT_346773 [Bisporella sp. PMI_857]
MCNQLVSVYACNHMTELGISQCELWTSTNSICARTPTLSNNIPALCYRCNIKNDASQISLKDLDLKAKSHINRLGSYVRNGKGSSRFGDFVVDDGMEEMNRLIDIYSAKVKIAEEKAMSAGKSLTEAEQEINELKSDEAEPEKKLPKQNDKGVLRELEAKMESITTFWRGQVRSHEEQIEKAGRTHSLWLIETFRSKLDKAHQIWDTRIKEAFEDAKSSLQ